MENAKAEVHNLFMYASFSISCLVCCEVTCSTRKGTCRGTKVYSGKCGAVTTLSWIKQATGSYQWKQQKSRTNKECVCLRMNPEKRSYGIAATELQQYCVIRKLQSDNKLYLEVTIRKQINAILQYPSFLRCCPAMPLIF